MDIKKLLDLVIAQNETIIRQNVELLLILSVLAEKGFKDGMNLDQNVEIAGAPPLSDGV